MRCDPNWTRLMLLPNKPTPESHGMPREPADEVSTRGLVPTISPCSSGRFLTRYGLETASGAVWAQS